MTAYARIGIRRTALTAQHMADADLEANLLQVELGNRVPNLWRQEVYEIAMVEDTASYDLPSRTIGIRDVYMSTTSGGTTTDRPLWPLSASEYDGQASKTLSGIPQTYYCQKSITPTITMWPVPDASSTYTVNVRLMTQMEDASIKSGATLDMPYRWLDVFVAGLAYRLSRSYAPQFEDRREKDFEKAWANAAAEDIEDNTGLTITPMTAGYWR